MARLLNIDEVRSAGRRLAGPFRLRVTHSGQVEEIRCDEIMRILPSKRIVCATEWRNVLAVAKIFLSRWRPRAKARRELQGYAALQHAGIRTPRVLAECVSADGKHPILIFERLASAEGFDQCLARCTEANARWSLLESAVKFIAKQHAAGVHQRDAHFGNILVQDNDLFAIDGSTVRTGAFGKPMKISAGIKSLGRFLAELPPSDDALLPALCEVYSRYRHHALTSWTTTRLTQCVRASRGRRVRVILGKVNRECTRFTRFNRNGIHVVCRRDFDSPELRSALTAPDETIAAGVILKNGNSATVARVQVAGRSLVIKRYNPSQLREVLRDFGPTSRARRAWKNAHLLEAFQIATATPIALIEGKYGPFKTGSYFVAEYVAGESGKTLFRRKDLSQPQAHNVATSTAALLARLHDAGISHGDLKDTNLLYRGSEPALIDVDAVRRHRTAFFASRGQFRDRRRLLRNFDASSPLYRCLAGCICTGLSSKPDNPTDSPIYRMKRGNLRVWFGLDCPVPLMSESMLNCLNGSHGPAVADGNRLKIYRRRSIFRIQNGDLSLVVKAFPFNHIKDKLRWKNYALAEFRNNRRARSLGIRTPGCYALFQIRRRGLVENCGVVMEDLQDYTDLASLAEKDETQILRAAPVIAALYATGVDHLDVTPTNVFFHKSTGAPAIIDWQYCRFHPPRNDVQLAMQAAHFLNFAEVEPHNELWTRWIAELHHKTGARMDLTVMKDNIENLQKQKLRVCDRLKAPESRFAA